MSRITGRNDPPAYAKPPMPPSPRISGRVVAHLSCDVNEDGLRDIIRGFIAGKTYTPELGAELTQLVVNSDYFKVKIKTQFIPDEETKS